MKTNVAQKIKKFDRLRISRLQVRVLPGVLENEYSERGYQQVPTRFSTIVDWFFAPAWLTVEEASSLVGYSAARVQAWVDAGYVDAENDHGRWLIDKRSLREYQEALFEVKNDA